MKKKAIIYTRVSTSDQKENGFSLQDQEKRLREHCIRKDYEIINHYQDDHSAKNFNRPAINALLVDLKTSKQKPDIVLSVRPDRFSRNFEETNRMRDFLRKKHKIEIEYLEQNYDDSIPENYLLYALTNIYPQIENERRGLNTKLGMRQALREGRWVWKAPIGYKNDKDSKTIIPDEKTSLLMIEAFEKMGMGIYSAEEVRKTLLAKGLKCSKNNFLNILKNPIYMGKIRLNAWKEDPEEIVPGIHTPLISSELFEKVQDFIKGRRKKISINVARNEIFELRPFLQCRICHNKLTGSNSTSRSGKKYSYYHCQHGCTERISTELAHQTFFSYISSFKSPVEVLSLYYRILKDVFKLDDKKRIDERNSIEALLEKNKTRQISLEDKLIDNIMDAQSYKPAKKRLDEEEQELLSKHLTLGDSFSSFDKHIKYSFSLLHDLPNYYANSTLEVRHKIIGSIFPEKLIFSENKYRTTRTNEVVSLLFNCDINNDEDFESIETKKAAHKAANFELKNGTFAFAPSPGLEPGTP